LLAQLHHHARIEQRVNTQPVGQTDEVGGYTFRVKIRRKIAVGLSLSNCPRR
jgi:hypothetical protein